MFRLFITRVSAETVVVKFEAREFVGVLADGKQYKFWSFNGTVPGPIIRVRLGDTVEFHLTNHADSQFPHNIDIHAVNAPGGGGSSEPGRAGRGENLPVQDTASRPVYIPMRVSDTQHPRAYCQWNVWIDPGGTQTRFSPCRS